MTQRSWIGLGALAVALLAGSARGAEAPPSAPAASDLVARGAYLARAGDCIACHTRPGGTPGAGGLRMATPFGDLVTPNITPDPATGIGTWSADDLYAAMHDGIGKGVGDLYPGMPYTFYTKVTRADSDAIYAYLQSLKPVSNAVRVDQLRWPFSMRWTMQGWRELFFQEGTFAPDATKSAEWNRGAYLVEGLGHCGACHTPRNAAGAVEPSKAFTGASVDGWFALSLTGGFRTGLGSWSVDQIVAYLGTGAAKGKSTALGDMAMVVHDSLSALTQDDLRAMAVYLKSLPPTSTLARPGGSTEPVPPQAATLYVDHCMGCHQAKGRGLPGIFPPLAGNPVVQANDPTDVIRAVLRGVPPRGGYPPMPGFASQLDDRQIAEIANYTRTSWGNGAPSNVTQELVAKLRASLASAR